MRKTSLFNPLLLLCISQPLHAAEPDNWTHLLNEPGFMPAIKSCLAVHPQGQGPAVVMNVWHASLEEAGVMTTDLGGGRQVCYASKQTGQVSRSETLFDLPGPLFVSVDQVSVAPKGTCIESTPVYVNLKLQGRTDSWGVPRRANTVGFFLRVFLGANQSSNWSLRTMLRSACRWASDRRP